MRCLSWKLIAISTVACALAHAADKPSPADLEFFETKIRPVLAKNCYGCHAGDIESPMGGLFLDSRTGILTGGKSGPADRPRQPRRQPADPRHPLRGPQNAALRPVERSRHRRPRKVGRHGRSRSRATPSHRSTASTIDIEKGRKYWAFQPP